MSHSIWLRFTALFVAGCAIAAAQAADVGLVNLVEGEVSYRPITGSGDRVKPFMRVRDGDHFNLPAGTRLSVVYFGASRQERWAGPGSFRAGEGGGEPIAGKPLDVVTLPTSAPARIARVPELIENARLGGLQVRGSIARSSPTNTPTLTLDAARVTYKEMRAQLPDNDITAEIFLYAVLDEHQDYAEMAEVAKRMLSKQPDNREVQSLAAWANRQAGR